MSNSNYDIAYLKKYVNGELSPTEMYALEREAQRDPMLADMLMGIEMDQNKTVIAAINQQISQRAKRDKVAKIKILDWKRLAIAASTVIVLGVCLVLFWQQEKNRSETKRTADVNVTQDKPKTTVMGEDSTTATDDIKSNIEPQDRSPQLADNNSPRFREQHPQEEVTILSREPSLRVKSLEEMEGRLNSDRPVFGLRPQDSATVISYTPIAKKKEASQTMMMRGNSSLNSTLAGKAAGISSVQQGGIPLQLTVRDKETGLPLSGVTIIQPNSKLATNTDAQGQATIQPSSVDSLVDIVALGYNTVAVNMRRSKNTTIRLQPSSNSLDEVVVTTMSSRKSKSAEPVWGWRSFNNYIKKKTAKSRYEGTVRISFYIDKGGFPTNISILQSANEYLDAKAKEIILSGPKWNGEDYRYVTLTFEFTM
ncbi:MULTISPECIES: TonB family protein [unclassified Sphingobacterium]|uniref:TonB family protein n=1 Tax=unclassified Sphingobacterium TaxID=2609468 RepID=UPI0025F9AE87|nr:MULTISPECIES: TonB family protein [unclassified Sphingobacterium]